MGMGHYERLLISHLMSESARVQWQFAFTCDGRIPEAMWGTDPSQHPDFAMRDSLGIANVRLQDAPYPLVRFFSNVRFSERYSSYRKALSSLPTSSIRSRSRSRRQQTDPPFLAFTTYRRRAFPMRGVFPDGRKKPRETRNSS